MKRTTKPAWRGLCGFCLARFAFGIPASTAKPERASAQSIAQAELDPPNTNTRSVWKAWLRADADLEQLIVGFPRATALLKI